MNSMSYQYDVALSFAGEDRAYIDKVANYLKSKGIKTFYDEFEETNIWGKDLVEHFDDIYRNQAHYCVLFISRFYAQKAWPRHEKQSALARALGEHGYILPVRFDDTDIPGLQPTIGYIDLRKKSPEQLSELIIQKISNKSNAQAKEMGPQYRRPKVSKTFDPYKESQTWVDYLIRELDKRCNNSEISFSHFSRESKQCLRFVIGGKPVYSVDIQLGGFHRDHGLSLSYAQGEMQMTSGFNAFADFEWNKEKECVVLNLNDFSVFSRSSSEQKFTKEEFLEYIWSKVCDATEEKY